MYCPNCGKMIPDGERNCSYCRTRLDYIASAESISAAENKNGVRRYNSIENPVQMNGKDTSGLRVVREMGTSRMFLVAVISYTVAIILSFIATGIASSSMTSSLGQLMNMAPGGAGAEEIHKYMQMYSSSIGAVGFAGTLIGNIPAILTAVALWLIFKESKKENGSTFATTGFTILRVLAIISFVALIVITVFSALGIISLIGAVSGMADSNSKGAFAVAGIVVLSFVGFMLLAIAYYWKLQKMLSKTKTIVSGGSASKVGSIYIGVITMVGTFSSLVAVFTAPGLGKIQALCSGVASVCFALLMFNYRERMEAVENASGFFDKSNIQAGYEYVVPPINNVPDQGFMSNDETVLNDGMGMHFSTQPEDTVMEDDTSINSQEYQNFDSVPTWFEDSSNQDTIVEGKGLSFRGQDPFLNREKPVLFNTRSEEGIAGEQAFVVEQGRPARERAEQERKAREVAERAEQERKAREVAERAEQERKAQEEAKRAEQERKAREEAERAEQERKTREEAERAEQERKAKEEAERAEHKKPALATEELRETRILQSLSVEQPEAYLIRRKDNAHITLCIPRLRIGRNLREVDYVIRDNSAIGRHHADIVFHDGEYFIIDLNSTNHVYVNGTMIPQNQEIHLQNQSTIRLADEEFTFFTKESGI